MGFFDFEEKDAGASKAPLPLSLKILHTKGCDVCPLNGQDGLKNPNMKATGSDEPIVYMLGEAPGADEDRRGKQFVGASGRVLRMRIPAKWDKDLRWNNVVRTRPPKNRNPTPVEVECCRPSIVRDIERTKPKAIFGFGAIPLEWAAPSAEARGITAWSGRSLPVRIGTHTCWYFPMFHPAYILRGRKYEPRSPNEYGSDLEFKFALDLERAFYQVNHLSEPIVDTKADALRDIIAITGHRPGDLDRVLDFIDECYGQQIVGLDYETSKLRPYMKNARILTAALAMKHKALAFSLAHKEDGWTDKQRRILRTHWKRFLKTSECRKVSHNLFFEQEWSAYEFGREAVLTDTWEDSMTQAYLLDERPKTHSLNDVCLQYFGIAIKDLFNINTKDMANEPLSEILPYNGLDAKYHRKVFVKQRGRLYVEQLDSCYEHAVRRVRSMALTAIKGVPVNHKTVERFFADHMRQMQEAEREVNELKITKQFNRRFGKPFSVGSNDHVAKALNEIAGIALEETKNKKRKSETKKKINLSTKEEDLKKIKHPLAKAVVKYRKVQKLISTYIIPIRQTDTVIGNKTHKTQLMHDGLLHPIIATTKTRTWRTSSEDPNIQNWPKRGPSKYIREQIEVADDEIIVAIDYAGIQARNVAMESLDRGLIKHYWDRYDIHSDWLDKVLKVVPNWVPPQDVGKNLSKKELRKEQRSVVKNKFVFPSFFGAIGKTVAGYLKIAENKGNLLSEMFFDEFPDVKAWHERLRDFYETNGYVTGLSKFRRRAPIEINQLINAPIQADETLIVCGAMARLTETGDERLQPNWMIHDDLTFIWKKKEMDKLLEQTVPLMLKQTHKWERTVPMEIEIAIGQNWCDLKEIAKFETTKDGGYKQVGGDYESDRWDYKVGRDGIVGERLRTYRGEKKL